MIRIKDVLIEYDKGGIQAVSYLLHQNDVDPSTWAGRIKKHIDEKHIFTAISQIELLLYKYKKPTDNEREISEPGG